MSDPVLLYTLTAVAVLIAGMSKGGFGAGAGFAATPLVALVAGPAQAAAIMLPILILMDQVGLYAYWRQWNWRIALTLMITALVGIALGALTFGLMDEAILKILIGGIALGFIVFRFMGQRQARAPREPGGWRAWLWGSVTGFVSFAVHAGGPPTSIYLIPLGLQRTVYQATTVLLFWWVNLVKLIPYFMLGLFTPVNLELSAIFAPLAILAMWLGIWAHKRISDKLFYRLILIFLAGAGGKLVWDGVAALV
ncbi:MAG: sulfite exporter TauE/SafE family protein [Azospirillaceae bacterium]